MRRRAWGVLLILALIFLATCARRPAGPVATETRLPPTPPRTATPVPTETPSPTCTSVPTPTETPTEESEEADTVRFTIVYDNNAHDPSLRTDWGFACLVHRGNTTVLFDTGANGHILLSNFTALELDPNSIDAVVLSHAHGDHTGGLSAVLGASDRATVYVPASFSQRFKDGVAEQTELVEVAEAVEVGDGFVSTGEVGSGIVEQALAVETAAGWVVLTGCAHPGIVSMVRQAKDAVDGEIALVMGGFHLGRADPPKIDGIIDAFEDMGVERVAPCHCTGDRARGRFKDAFGDDCLLAGVGQVIEIDSNGEMTVLE